jgi:thiol-disulfide isomerase/thioredoxin
MIQYILVAVAVLAAYYYFTNSEGFYSGDKKSLVLYYLPGCGFCTQMMPEWNALAKSHQGDSKVNIKKINCADKPEEAEANGIEGFPTIVLFNSGDRKVYDGARTKKALEGFINAN